MKSLIIFLFAFSSFAHHGGGGGLTGAVSGNSGIPVVLPLPINILADGSHEFSWDWWGFAPHGGDHTTEPAADHAQGETISWYFSPLIYLNGDKFKLYLNLEEQIIDKSISLEEADAKKGFLVIERSLFEIGAGMGAYLPFSTGLTVGVGLLPIVGTSIYSERHAPSLMEAKNLPKVKIPHNMKHLGEWQENDLLIYTKKGGISFFGQGGFSGIVTGLGYSAQGEWRVTLKKSGEGKILANVSKVKLNSLGFYSGIEFSTINLSLFGSHDKSFSYEFDVNEKIGQEAFENFLKGNFKFTQKMIMEGVEGVTPLTQSESQTFGRAFGAHMGLPFLASLDFRKEMLRSFSQIHSFKNNEKVENTMAVYTRSLETNGVLSRRTKKLAMFAASHQVRLNPEKHEGHSHESGPSFTTANFKWMFSRLRVKSHVFEREINQLKKITGLWNSLEFNLPMENIGYAKMEFDGMISSKGTERLMAEGLKSEMSLLAQDGVENFFQQDSNPGKLCKVFKKVENCKNHLLKTTNRAMKKISQKLAEMKNLAQDKNWKSFTETYAEVGKEAMTNQFTFQTFLKLLGKDNFSMEFKVSGEKLKTIYIHNFKEDPIF
jgi:hypothetical protein